MKKYNRKAMSFILTLAMVVTIFAGLPLTVSADNPTVYLKATGLDSSDGATTGTAVATFARAKELLATAGTIVLDSSLEITDSQVWDLADNPLATVEEDLSKAYSIRVTGNGTLLTLSAIRLINPSSASYANRYMLQVGSVPADNSVLTLNPGTIVSAENAGAAVRINYGVANIGSGVALSGGSLGNISIGSSGRIKITDNLTNEISIGLVTAMRDEGDIIGTVEEGITEISKLVYCPSAAAEERYFRIDENNNIVVTLTDPAAPPPATYTVTATATTGGAISPAGVTTVTEGGSLTYTITPDEDYYISDVRADGVSVTTGSSYTFSNVTTNHAIATEFTRVPITTVPKTLDFYVGSDCRSDTLPEGRTVTITNNTGSEITLAEPESTTRFAVGLSSTAIPAEGSVTLTVTPSAANIINSTTGGLLPEYINGFDGPPYASSENTFTDTITVNSDSGSNITVTAGFHVKRAKTVTVVGAENGTVRVGLGGSANNPYAWYLDRQGGITFSESVRHIRDGEEATILALITNGQTLGNASFMYIPDTGYLRELLTVYSEEHPGGQTVSPGGFEQIGPWNESNERFVATFVIDTFTITSSVLTSGGGVTPGGTTVVEYGTDREFTITPDPGYHIEAVYVDRVATAAAIDPATGIGRYTFSDITEEHEIAAGFAENSYTVAFDKNAADAAGTMADQTGFIYGTPAPLTPGAFTRSGYTFAGWATASTGVVVYADRAMVNIPAVLDGQTVTLYAIWTANSSPSGSGGSGGGTAPTPGANITAGDDGGQKAVASADIPAATDNTGKATANVDKNTLDSALAKARQAAQDADRKAGNQAGTTGVEIKVEVKAASNAKAVETSLPVDTLNEMASQTNSQLTVNTPVAGITLDQAALAAIAGQAGSKVTISAEKVDTSALPEETRERIGDAPVYDLKVMGESGAITSFNGGTATVSVPYDLKPGESPEQVAVYYIDSAGNFVKMNCVYDPITKTAKFATDHFSYYAVVIEAGTAGFTDISRTAWYYDAVSYVVEKGILNGTGYTSFSPGADMTRAMFVTALGRASGVDPADYAAAGFSDVNIGGWYGGYVQWAYENNIISGVGGGRFAPDQAITREQMASILTGYCKWKGETVSTSEVQLGYPDTDRISGWALEGVRLCTANEWLTGYPDGSFQPQRTASRAEVAAILQRCLQTAL